MLDTDEAGPAHGDEAATAREGEADVARRHEVAGLLAGAATLLSGLALGSYDLQGGENWIGPVGAGAAGLAVTAFGVAAWVLPMELGLLTVRLFRRMRSPLGVARAASTLVFLFVGCALLHLSLRDVTVFGGHLPGGVLGEVLGEVLRSLLGVAGAFVVGITTLLVTLVLRTSVSIVALYRLAADGTTAAGTRVWRGGKALVEAWREAKELERAAEEERRRALEPRIVETPSTAGLRAPPTLAGAATPAIGQAGADDDDAGTDGGVDADADNDARANGEAHASADDDAPDDADDAELEAAWEADDRDGADPDADEPDADQDDVARAPARARSVKAESAEASGGKTSPGPEGKPAPGKAPQTSSRTAAQAPIIVAPAQAPLRPACAAAPDTVVVPAVAPTTASGQAKTRARPFALPPTTLLSEPPTSTVKIDAQTLRDNAARLVEKLEAYGVSGRVDEIHPGPVVTMYEMEPASGTKVSKIASLSDDLAMALAAQKVRIVAPIPGKARVGFELPNKHRQSVALREILEDARWHEHSQRAALPMALGKDIAGQPVYADMAKMPHLLVAGATGAGKSVGLNVMLTSLLMRKTPEEVRMLMIDPKVVELAAFDGIPHMLLPVVTDMKKASLALRWAVDEMERRYQLFADAGAKNIVTYNERVERVHRGELAVEKLLPRRVNKVSARGPDGEEVLLPPDGDEAPDAIAVPDKLPYIVVVVDEFADLMMVAAKDVEAAIARLAQKARAAGIHVILATQRPSVDVITGMIKANFPARIAFKVAQRQDSQTILGQNGAEHLLGMGDMLMIPPGASELRRVHCAFISEDEVQAVTDHLRSQGKPVYDENILKPRDEEDGGGGAGEGSVESRSDDPIYDKAVALVAQAGYCSISHLQRHLSVGYNKAAKLVERMEKEGIVGPASGKAGGRREVLVQAL